MQWSPQILHCNDWHTAFAPLFLKALYDWDRLFAGTRSVLTIHNIGYQGVFASSVIEDLSLGPKNYLLHQDDLRAGRINPLRHGILYADAITTVSPTHAREICTDQYGMGLQDSLRARGGALIGILNGVDYDEWDPRHDRYLPKHFDPDTLGVKAELKQTTPATHWASTISPATPLAGIVTPTRVPEGHRPDVRFAARGARMARARLGCAGQRRSAVREILHRAAAELPRPRCFPSRLLTTSWRTGSKRPATCF